ncbi:D-alanyl-D-alanine dipeptidase [Pantoea vagans C9-1]|jgi:D-alanyl-D-alanine dipeptidase|uniref:D-alanyl-D-alanine dipeptidase n=1 Tax=Pantoea vagans TaxID=470934 RepID=UPI0001E5935D|nr:D-alanyl-D-alanine dipeptidase [Pantoea vagans]ADO08659.1 D-alanyl-D-alanine dipeptidase [Pantoea vagans C9-1]
MESKNLVDIAEAFPQSAIDLKYATADNLTGQPIYRDARCLLHADAARALAKSIDIANVAGYSLLILDAYRPPAAQAILWQACPNQDYVAPLTRGSNHSRGTAVDVTLIDEQGEIVDMGTGFDEMSEHSHPYHPAVPVQAQRNRLMLNAIMLGGGFTGIASEWWHFELPGSETYPLIDGVFDCYSSPQAENISL